MARPCGAPEYFIALSIFCMHPFDCAIPLIGLLFSLLNLHLFKIIIQLSGSCFYNILSILHHGCLMSRHFNQKGCGCGQANLKVEEDIKLASAYAHVINRLI